MFTVVQIFQRLYSQVAAVLISVRLWNFKDGGSKKARFLAKNQYTQRKPLYFDNTRSDSLSKIGHDLKSGSKIEVRKKCFLHKMIC